MKIETLAAKGRRIQEGKYLRVVPAIKIILFILNGNIDVLLISIRAYYGKGISATK